MRILIADDDRVCCQALMMYLSLLGDVETAGTGRQAIDAVRSAHDADKPYGLIFLDILMPEGDGQEVLRKIRAMESKRGIHGLDCVKVVMTTCLEDRKQVMNAFRGQAEAYLMKPVDPSKLREVLREFGILGKGV
jgi:two-component system chemotaxis response regulator CheY